MIFSIRRFLQKTNKRIQFYYYETFWRKLKTSKRHFEIIWPLVDIFLMHISANAHAGFQLIWFCWHLVLTGFKRIKHAAVCKPLFYLGQIHMNIFMNVIQIVLCIPAGNITFKIVHFSNDHHQISNRTQSCFRIISI